MLSGGDISSLAILTPYNGQVRELQSHQKKLLAAAGRDVSIDISSVDAYQVQSCHLMSLHTEQLMTGQSWTGAHQILDPWPAPSLLEAWTKARLVRRFAAYKCSRSCCPLG